MKTTFLAALLATAVGASFAAAPTAALNHDPATYNSVTQKVAADYKVAAAACTSMSGNAKLVCMEEAKAARVHAQADAVAQYNNTPKSHAKALTAAADADFSLAKAKCGDMTGAQKDSCLSNAASVHVAAVADAKAAGTGMVDKTRETASGTVDNTRDAAAVAAGTGTGVLPGDQMGDRSAAATPKTGAVVADSVITTKVKADIFKEPELKSMAIHVETEKGVVMLSGFVDSKADADKAVQVAKGVEGVANVKSAIKVK